jgi:hypothetical protein
MGAMVIEAEEKIDSSKDVFFGLQSKNGDSQETRTLTPYLYLPS